MTSLWQLKRFEARISLFKSLDCPLALAAAGMNQRFTRYPSVKNHNLGWCNWRWPCISITEPMPSLSCWYLVNWTESNVTLQKMSTLRKQQSMVLNTCDEFVSAQKYLRPNSMTLTGYMSQSLGTHCFATSTRENLCTLKSNAVCGPDWPLVHPPPPNNYA